MDNKRTALEKERKELIRKRQNTNKHIKDLDSEIEEIKARIYKTQKKRLEAQPLN